MSYAAKWEAGANGIGREVDWEAKSPAEIDAVWFEAAGRLQVIQDRLAQYRRWAAEAEREYERARYTEQHDRYAAEVADEVRRLRAAIQPLQAEWDRRGGWKRYLICQTDGGHFHKNGCHTLGRGEHPSGVAWVADVSGLDDEEVIEKVGFRACSQPDCFPLAPVHPAWARSEAEYKRKTADERLAKWQKGRDMREKKLLNARKRLERGEAKLAKTYAMPFGDERRYEEISADSDIKYASQDVRWAERELARWDAKRPTA